MKLIRNWDELSKVSPNDKYKIIVGDCNGWIVPICDENDDDDDFICHCKGKMRDEEFFKHHYYLSTHTFYGSNYKHSTEILKKYGFDIEIDNWDK